MKSKGNLKELISDKQELKLNYLKMMMSYIEDTNNKISKNEKEDLLLLYLFLESI